jgi:multicomponent K+:H+ antiporter subunit D
MSHLVIAPILLPAVLAGLILLVARGIVLQRLIALAGAAGFLALALLLTGRGGAPVAYHLGNWPAPFGIVLIADGLSVLMLLLLAAVALPVLVYTMASGWDARGRHFHALFLFLLAGLAGAFLTADAFNLFVFFELLLIASYGLMVHGGGAARLRAGIQYVGFNLVGSTLFLFALATIYAVTGTLNMADLAQKWPLLPPGDQALARVAAVLLLMVFAVKGALVPLQFWLPGTYAAAPGPVAALFAIMTKVGAYAALRLGWLVFDAGPTAGMWAELLEPAALATLALGAVGVLGSRDLPRQAAFAAIGSMGLVFLGVAAATPEATVAALYYLIHSTLAGAALFLVADLAGRRGASGPVAALFMASAIAVAGLPPLSGFLGKILLLQALEAQAPLIWSAVLLASFLTILGFALTGSARFWKARGTAPTTAEPLALAATGLLLAGLVAMTLLAGPLTLWLQGVAEGLSDPAPYIAATAPQSGG